MNAAKYQVVKPDTVVLEAVGMGAQLVEYYQKFVTARTGMLPSELRYLPSKLQKIPVKPGQMVEVEYGERTVLQLEIKILQVVYYTDDGHHRGEHRTLTYAPMTVNVDGVKYEGEAIAYDDDYPNLTLGLWALRALNDAAKSIGGSHLEPPPPDPILDTKSSRKNK